MMPAGKYYIGDLCYVMHEEWSEVCDVTCDENECLFGEFTLKSGTRFAMYGTEFGDGVYEGLSVDSGSIGCVLLSDIDLTNPENDIKNGRIVEFDKPFKTWERDCVIYFGNIAIDTGDYEDDEDDENDDE